VFGVTIPINFHFAIVKRCVAIVDGSHRKARAVSLGGDGGNKTIFFFKWQECS
jgi:hypothetical protein